MMDKIRTVLRRLKARLAAMWRRFKALVYAVLIALGIISAPILYAGTLELAWTNATERVDGTPFDAATEQAAIRIYCNGDVTPTFVSAGAAANLDQITAAGDYECYATTVDTDGLESFASNTITKTVSKALPRPPVLWDN